MLAHGHPNLRMTHEKTFELTAEPVVGERATCVIGVRAEFPPDLALLRGDVTIRLAAGSASASGTATINPDHAVGDRAIIRRSDHRDADTLAIRATLTAADLSPEFLDEVRAGAPITMRITEVRKPSLLVILGATEPGSRLAAFADMCGSAYRLDDWVSPPARERLAKIGPARFVAAAPAADLAVPLLAAGLPATPAVMLGPLDRAALRDPAIKQALHSSPLPVLASAAPEQAVAVFREIAGINPDRRIALPDNAIDIGTAMEWVPAGVAAGRIEATSHRIGRTVGATDESVVFVIAAAEAGDVLAVRAVVDAMRAVGVPARTVADALAPLGWDRREVYRKSGV